MSMTISSDACPNVTVGIGDQNTDTPAHATNSVSGVRRRSRLVVRLSFTFRSTCPRKAKATTRVISFAIAIGSRDPSVRGADRPGALRPVNESIQQTARNRFTAVRPDAFRELLTITGSVKPLPQSLARKQAVLFRSPAPRIATRLP